ncbi:MAG: hypothetical protein IJV22_03440 [Bacteroidales bacterium]|nr:hypothetical protein [Bacteroidales bacterium]
MQVLVLLMISSAECAMPYGMMPEDCGLPVQCCVWLEGKGATERKFGLRRAVGKSTGAKQSFAA